ncbi:MAG TPA: class I SAM-dependent methyltransferase [Anaerolineales bacterium]|nr:class I SAM-dependent methyltransferase [Anaerolineales bacterium]
MQEKIEILPVDLLEQHRPLVNDLKKLARSLGQEFGWHYLLDLTWIIHQLGDVQGKRILDAGAGTGVIQWYLADQGAEVLSVDRMSRANLPLRFRNHFRVSGLRPSDLDPYSQVVRQNFKRQGNSWRKLSAQAKELGALTDRRRSPGKVLIYNQDLRSLPAISTDSVDAVVAVSALEHNHPNDLGNVIQELLRVLKPGGIFLATLGAAREQDWLHSPSQGWCYTDTSLRRLFNLPADIASNYDQFAELFEALRNCAELRDNLAKFYFRSGDNGMPWGIWDPKYPTVGVCKLKASTTV